MHGAINVGINHENSEEHAQHVQAHQRERRSFFRVQEFPQLPQEIMHKCNNLSSGSWLVKILPNKA